MTGARAKPSDYRRVLAESAGHSDWREDTLLVLGRSFHAHIADLRAQSDGFDDHEFSVWATAIAVENGIPLADVVTTAEWLEKATEVKRATGRTLDNIHDTSLHMGAQEFRDWADMLIEGGRAV